MKKLEKKIKHSIWEFIFYSNFFMGLMSVALNVETTLKTKISFSYWDYYCFIAASTVLFYLFAYNVPKKYNSSANPRTQFYIDFRFQIKLFKVFLWILALISSCSIVWRLFDSMQLIGFFPFLILGSTFFLCSSYYNWKFGFSLRKYTWFKPFLIAWAWAITTVYLPVLINQLETGVLIHLDSIFWFHFIDIFMFFMVNAIMFDMKDFEDDTNRGVKTFVVRYGTDFMLNKVILPFIFLGLLVSIGVGFIFDYTLVQMLSLILPILFMALFASRLSHSKPILYYLVAIDGIIAVKAVLGIIVELI